MSTPNKPPNVVLVVVDTLRLDRGSKLASVLEGAINYGWAVTPAPWTLPAHVSLLTGLYPSIHESHENAKMSSFTDWLNLRNDKATLMTRLKKLGYTTYGFSANSFISSAFGFNGFDVLKNWMDLTGWTELLFEMDERSKEKFERFTQDRTLRNFLLLLVHFALHHTRALVSGLFSSLTIQVDKFVHKWPYHKGFGNMIRFLKRTKFKEPFFFFVNILELHEPYSNSGESMNDGIATRATSEDQIERWVSGYDRQLDRVARELPKLVEILKRKQLFENTLLILTSDHGQLLGENGLLGHGQFLFDELVKVPLIIKYPADLRFQLSNSKNYISLTAVPNFILDIVSGRLSDSSLFSQQVFSESWPSIDETSAKSNLANPIGHRVRVFSKEGTLTYNLTYKKVEESIIEEKKELEDEQFVIKQLIEKCIRFTLLNEKLLNTIMREEENAVIVSVNAADGRVSTVKHDVATS